jgi:5'-deoxynucleotidase YfbR-like HD superfamily hydrolase
MKTNPQFERVLFARRGSRVLRYHTHGPIRPDTVGQHSHGVGMLCIVLRAGNPGEALLKAALTHDLAEHVLGDIPSPAKRAMDRQKLNTMEHDLLRAARFEVELTEFDGWVLKLADILDGMLFCTEELTIGNHSLDDVFETYFDYFESHCRAPMSLHLRDAKGQVLSIACDIAAGINATRSKYER